MELPQWTAWLVSRGKRDRTVLGEICGAVSFALLFFFKCLFCYFMGIKCLHVCLCTTFMPAPLEARRRLLIPWNWSRDDCELPCKYWELNPDPFPKRQMLLTTEPSAALAPVFLNRVPLCPLGKRKRPGFPCGVPSTIEGTISDPPPWP